MARITIQDLSAKSTMTELDNNEIDSISGSGSGCTGNYNEKAGCYTGRGIRNAIDDAVEGTAKGLRTAKNLYENAREGHMMRAFFW